MINKVRLKKGKRNWRLGERQFCYVMGNTEQAPLGFYFLQTPQKKSAEAPILFDAAKNGLDIHVLGWIGPASFPY